jgi:hypothetical protein
MSYISRPSTRSAAPTAKGRNNSLIAAADDPGTPYAIGPAEGGHDAVHPQLGTLDDFRRLVSACADHGMEIAFDFAIQCSPAIHGSPSIQNGSSAGPTGASSPGSSTWACYSAATSASLSLSVAGRDSNQQERRAPCEPSRRSTSLRTASSGQCGADTTRTGAVGVR